jgi:hypothetical protein
MEVFYVANEESFVLFEWLSQKESTLVARLIKAASTDAALEIRDDADECDIAVERLAEELRHHIEDVVVRAGYGDYGAGVIDELQPGDLMTGRLLRCAMLRIDFERVAEALLRKANRWRDASVDDDPV